MKQLITLVLLSISLVSFSQDKTKCTGKTKAGTSCGNNAQAGTAFCGIHNPASLRCGAKTKAGAECKAIVKTAGAKCHNHNKA